MHACHLGEHYRVPVSIGALIRQASRWHALAAGILLLSAIVSQTAVAQSAATAKKGYRPPTRTTSSATQRPAAHSRNAVRSAAHSYEGMVAPGAAHGSLEPIPMQEIHLTDMAISSCDSCGAADGNCGCNPFGYLLDWSRGDLWIGTASFTGASGYIADTGTTEQIAGSFGFQEGFNFGTRLPGLLCGQIGSQIGMRFVQTQLDGSTASNDSRSQTFATAGLFRRVDYGVQGGLVVDYLHDDWLYQADLLQLRGELSYLFSPCHDLGMRFTDSQQIDDTQAFLSGRTTPVQLRLSSLNTYRFFYRYRFGQGGAGLAELQAGFTEDADTVLGLDLKVPLQNQLGLAAGATYVLPASDTLIPYAREGWNMSLAIVWTPGRGFGTRRDYYRPLFDVADNGSLLSKHAP